MEKIFKNFQKFFRPETIKRRFFTIMINTNIKTLFVNMLPKIQKNKINTREAFHIFEKKMKIFKKK